MAQLTKAFLGLAFLLTITSCNKEEFIRYQENEVVETPTFYPVQKVTITQPNESGLRAGGLDLSNVMLQMSGEDGRIVQVIKTEKEGFYKLNLLRGNNIKHTLYLNLEGESIQLKTLKGRHLITGKFLSNYQKLVFTNISFGTPISDESLRVFSDTSTASKLCGIGLGLIGGGIAGLGAIPTAGTSFYAFTALYTGLTMMICDGW